MPNAVLLTNYVPLSALFTLQCSSSVHISSSSVCLLFQSKEGKEKEEPQRQIAGQRNASLPTCHLRQPLQLASWDDPAHCCPLGSLSSSQWWGESDQISCRQVRGGVKTSPCHEGNMVQLPSVTGVFRCPLALLNQFLIVFSSCCGEMEVFILSKVTLQVVKE